MSTLALPTPTSAATRATASAGPPGRATAARWCWLALALAAAMAASAGCLIGGGVRCESDADCGGALCARNGECTEALVFVRITWTVAGLPATEENCAAHPWLSVTFEDSDYEDALTYEPIRCTLEQINFDRMPGRYDVVEIRADDAGGQPVTSLRSAIAPPGITLEVDLGAQAVPAN
jgi:hypothetical protein